MDSPCYRNSEYAVYLFDKFLETGFVPETFVYIGERGPFIPYRSGWKTGSSAYGWFLMIWKPLTL